MSKSLQARWFKVCEKKALMEAEQDVKQKRVLKHQLKTVTREFRRGVAKEYGTDEFINFYRDEVTVWAKDYKYKHRVFRYSEPLG